MRFSEQTRPTYDEAIGPAIRDAGYRALRIDRKEHNNRIDDEIVGEIRRSRFMVADLACQSHNVYYEAGFMQGLGRPVIWMRPRPQIEHVKFDVRQYSCILYDNPAEALPLLRNRILATQGEGPEKR